ncbi:hypothetical protein L345_02753, partial [Ophiophagus hannah]
RAGPSPDRSRLALLGRRECAHARSESLGGGGEGGVLLLRSREKWSENQRSVRFSPPSSGLFKISGAYSCLKSPQPPFSFLLHRSRQTPEHVLISKVAEGPVSNLWGLWGKEASSRTPWSARGKPFFLTLGRELGEDSAEKEGEKFAWRRRRRRKRILPDCLSRCWERGRGEVSRWLGWIFFLFFLFLSVLSNAENQEAPICHESSRSAHLASHPRRACLELLRVSLQKGKGLCSRCCGNRVWEERREREERERERERRRGWGWVGSQTFKSAWLDGRPATRDSGWRRPGIKRVSLLASRKAAFAGRDRVLYVDGGGVWNRGRQASPFRRFKSEVTKTHGAFCLLSSPPPSTERASQKARILYWFQARFRASVANCFSSVRLSAICNRQEELINSAGLSPPPRGYFVCVRRWRRHGGSAVNMAFDICSLVLGPFFFCFQPLTPEVCK